MTTIVDARGLSCARPVINTKKALEEIEEGVITVIVDNPESKRNVTLFARSQGCRIEVEEREDASYLQITKGHPTEGKSEPEKPTVVCITTDKFGVGEDELGAILMNAFLNTLWDYEPRPATLLFINSGVMLTTEGSEVLESLNLLEQEGVEVFSCGTCLEYYGIKDRLRVGKVTNMYEMVAALMTADKVINI